MQNLFKFNAIVYFKSQKLLMITLGVVLFFILLLFALKVTKEGYSVNQLYFQQVDFSFKVLNFTIICIYPFIFISYLQLELDNNFQERVEVIPLSKLSQIHSKVMLFLIIESGFWVIYFLVMELKLHNSSTDYRLFLIQNLITYLLFSIPYIYILTSLFYYFKHTTYLYLAHFFLSILSFFDSFFWLPNSWGKFILSFNIYTKQNIPLSFYDNHPIKFFYLYFVVSIVLVLFLNKKSQNENK